MSRWSPRFFRWHRWLAWLVVVQIVAWVLGGLVFAWLPFQAWVKSADHIHRPAAPLPAGWAAALATAELPARPVLSATSLPTALGPAWRLKHAEGPDTWLDAAGRPLPPPDEAAVRAFAQQIYHGPGLLVAAERLATPPRRLGIVREVGNRQGLWAVHFDDGLATRVYIDGASGEFVTARNEAWVVYDFFWRLHVMDYAEGEDFNNGWLRAASLAAGALVFTGAALLMLSLLRRLRQRERRAHPVA